MRTDVIVVGAGFAGVSAARELSRHGLRAVVLEARDRIGGRTWTSEFEGQQVELGGTWLHWHQPHVYAEITRYGLALTESPTAPLARWCDGEGGTREGAMSDLWGLMVEGTDRLCADARQAFERPHDPLFADIASIDRLSIEDRLHTLGLSPELEAITRALWQSAGNAFTDEVGLSAPLRWYALAGFSYDAMLDCAGRYKLVRGTRALIEAIAGDADAEIRLDSPVASVEQAADGVVCELRDGTRVEGRAAIVAVPLNVLRAIAFSPALADDKRPAIEAGQASHGVKLWGRIRGELDRFVVGAPGEWVTYMQPEYRVDGDTLVVGFGPSAEAFDVTDQAAGAELLGRLYPGAEVVGSHGHDWTADEFSRGTWSMYRPGQLTGSLRALQAPEGRVLLAGSDVANGWNGFIDGAIESGVRAAGWARDLIHA